jgi:nucleotide sugar dehydrogenase
VVLPILKQTGLVPEKDFYLCFSPERVNPGDKDFPVTRIPKLVGGTSYESGSLALRLYSQIIARVTQVSSAEVAETAKLLENTFRMVNIALANEFSIVCHKLGISIWEVIAAAATKPFGFMPFYPGPGVGGHCIPKDPLYLYWKARHHGFRSRFIKLASSVISQMPEYVATRVIALLKNKNAALKKIKILVIGATYKKDVKDLRKSPAIDIIEILERNKIAVSYYDPLIPYLKLNYVNLKSIKLNKSNLGKFDCVLIATDHSEIDYKFLLENSKLIFDTRNVFKNIRSSKLFRL